MFKLRWTLIRQQAPLPLSSSAIVRLFVATQGLVYLAMVLLDSVVPCLEALCLVVPSGVPLFEGLVGLDCDPAFLINLEGFCFVWG